MCFPVTEGVFGSTEAAVPMGAGTTFFCGGRGFLCARDSTMPATWLRGLVSFGLSAHVLVCTDDVMCTTMGSIHYRKRYTRRGSSLTRDQLSTSTNPRIHEVGSGWAAGKRRASPVSDLPSVPPKGYPLAFYLACPGPCTARGCPGPGTVPGRGGPPATRPPAHHVHRRLPAVSCGRAGTRTALTGR